MAINFFENQYILRKRYLQDILSSTDRKKIIVAGPGTGKTYTFKKLLRRSGVNNNLVLTFINKLVQDMEKDLGELAEVKTFHAFCKKLLHEKRGGFELFPFLNQIIYEDAECLGISLSNFSNAFQTLQEDSEEIKFYLSRGNYYNSVCFDDSVYRVYKESQINSSFIPQYNQILIDEYQDFNPLEVAFINELQKRNPILIVGDDDQAVYSARNSSPNHLREIYNSGEFTKFELPFCSRCPRVIVEAVTSFTNQVIENEGFVNRINRKYIPFLEDKEYENEKYPKIINAEVSNIKCLSNLINASIINIPPKDIKESQEENYPCILIVGKRQYLNPIYKSLSTTYNNVTFKQSENRSYSYCDAYCYLLNDRESNLGWRIIAGLELNKYLLEEIIKSLVSRVARKCTKSGREKCTTLRS